jgi:ABC-type phosphate transport system substrate-binding protein
MHSLSARRVLSACALSAASVAAMLAPGVASAAAKSKVPPACENGALKITGQGSSLQAPEQEGVWTKEFNIVSTKDFGCPGTPGTVGAPEVKYAKSGSGTALKSWGAEAGNAEEPFVGFGVNNAFIGVDEPPNEEQLTGLDSQETAQSEGAESVESIPVAQAAVALIVHLPEGCSANTKAAGSKGTGRLTLTDEDVKNIYEGTYTTWGAIKNGDDASELKAGDDAITGTATKLGDVPCTSVPIKVVVRKDGSGTTHITKRFLGQIDSSTELPIKETDGKTTATWGELSEASLNKTWPTATDAVVSANKGGGGLAEEVNAQEGSIGYLNLFEARAKGFAPATSTHFWVEVQNSDKAGKPGYADPSTNGDTSTEEADSNCKLEDYVVAGSDTTFPPKSTLVPWDKVATNLTEKVYSLCGLTYDIAFKNYFSVPGTTQAEEETVKQYLQFLTNKKGGQALLKDHDYLELPAEVAALAVEGAGQIEYTKG